MVQEIPSIDSSRCLNASPMGDLQYFLPMISPLGEAHADTLRTLHMRSHLPLRRIRRLDVFTTFAKSQRCRNWNGRPGSQNRRTGLEDSLYYRESEPQSTCCCQGIRRNMWSPPLSAFVPSCAT